MDKLSIPDLHIVLIEPSDTQRKIITTLLLKEKVKEIDPVSTVAEAKAALKTHSADLIVSAMYFEDGTALELLKYLKESDEFNAIPFMLVSSENRLSKLEEFKPECILISAGFDAHHADPLAQMQLTDGCYSWMTEQLMEVASKHCNGRIISLLEGGYDLEALPRCIALHVNTLQQTT